MLVNSTTRSDDVFHVGLSRDKFSDRLSMKPTVRYVRLHSHAMSANLVVLY